LGYFARTRAAVADTKAVASEVPSDRLYFWDSVLSAERTCTPGAIRASPLPLLEPFHRFASLSTAPTATTPGSAAGSSMATAPVFPAAATTTTSRASAYAIASRPTDEVLPPSAPKDRLMTFAPWSTAYRTA